MRDRKLVSMLFIVALCERCRVSSEVKIVWLACPRFSCTPKLAVENLQIHFQCGDRVSNPVLVRLAVVTCVVK